MYSRKSLLFKSMKWNFKGNRVENLPKLIIQLENFVRFCAASNVGITISKKKKEGETKIVYSVLISSCNSVSRITKSSRRLYLNRCSIFLTKIRTKGITPSNLVFSKNFFFRNNTWKLVIQNAQVRQIVWILPVHYSLCWRQKLKKKKSRTKTRIEVTLFLIPYVSAR